MSRQHSPFVVLFVDIQTFEKIMSSVNDLFRSLSHNLENKVLYGEYTS